MLPDMNPIQLAGRRRQWQPFNFNYLLRSMNIFFNFDQYCMHSYFIRTVFVLHFSFIRTLFVFYSYYMYSYFIRTSFVLYSYICTSLIRDRTFCMLNITGQGDVCVSCGLSEQFGSHVCHHCKNRVHGSLAHLSLAGDMCTSCSKKVEAPPEADNTGIFDYCNHTACKSEMKKMQQVI